MITFRLQSQGRKTDMASLMLFIHDQSAHALLLECLDAFSVRFRAKTLQPRNTMKEPNKWKNSVKNQYHQQTV